MRRIVLWAAPFFVVSCAGDEPDPCARQGAPTSLCADVWLASDDLDFLRPVLFDLRSGKLELTPERRERVEALALGPENTRVRRLALQVAASQGDAKTLEKVVAAAGPGLEEACARADFGPSDHDNPLLYDCGALFRLEELRSSGPGEPDGATR